MNATVPSRSALLDLRDERRSLAEGHAFLDEKCLVLAAEMLRQAAKCRELREAVGRAADVASSRLAAAASRHGLEALACLPPGAARDGITLGSRPVMGVDVLDSAFLRDASPAAMPAHSSPEARECALAFRELVAAAAVLAGASTSLERLAREYRRTIRRARAVGEVLLPAADRDVAGMEAQLEDLEREEAIQMKLGARPSGM